MSLTLFRAPEPKATSQLADRQMRFLNTAKPGSGFKVGDYAHAANVSERQARRDLAETRNAWVSGTPRKRASHVLPPDYAIQVMEAYSDKSGHIRP